MGWPGSSQLGDVTYHLGGDVGTFDNGWFDSEESSRDNAIAAGVQAGYNYQLDGVVVGVEADLSDLGVVSSYSTSYSTTLYDDSSPLYNYNLDENMDVTSEIEWFGTIRARLGVTPVDRLLVYGTGGLAYGQVNSAGGYRWHEYGYWWGGPGDHFFDRSGSVDGSSDGIRWGWTVGAGLEYALSDRFSLKAEYLYADLGTREHSSVSPEDSSESVTWTESTQFHTVRLGLNYKF